jgi:hypothetical protein
MPLEQRCAHSYRRVSDGGYRTAGIGLRSAPLPSYFAYYDRRRTQSHPELP